MHIIFEKFVKISKIKISPKSIIKCTNCPQYNKNPSCPPNSPDYFLSVKWISSYKKALFIKCYIDNTMFEHEKREMIKMLLEKEKYFFSQNKFYAYALFPGNCNLCPVCSYETTKVCQKPSSVRYSLDAVGIQLDSLVKIDFSESVLYGLVLID
ncbi:MAG: DUF2284 domain-containing protein [Desulfurella sp.]|uniref:DUF2284 domain-containing protein n=1 Tax=Desulfurella TaxID=33001 RepID=UPI0003E0908D|nr:DUF2284 domain-containing protein [Desulfurella multipotens]AHF97464.1 hypothetical protein DESACE_08200 [Desulfurella acetivorans A63]PMP62708.1 MAG: metal-binding protein [Desulfurella multipotens]